MATVRFTIICRECVRIEHSPSGRFVDAPSLMTAGGARRERTQVQRVVIDAAGGEPVELSTERFVLRFSPRGEGLTEQTLSVQVKGPFAPGGPAGEWTEWRPGAMQTANLGGTLSTLDGLTGPVELPEGLLSRDGWYLIDDTRGHLLIDGWVSTRAQVGLAENTDLYLFAYGSDYAAALNALGVVAGRVPMPRRYALGSWYSRYWPHTSAEYRQIVADYARHRIPLDVLVLDMDWHRPGWTGWSWNRELLPDAEGLLAWAHEQGLAVTLNLHPADGVAPHEDRYAELMRAIGKDPGSGETVPFDAGDERYMRALFEEVHRPLERDGVDFWWLDWQQAEMVESVPGLAHLVWLNKLYFDHTTGEQPDGRRGLSFSRWPREIAADGERRGEGARLGPGAWSDHRHPIHFSGDAHTGWKMLAFQVPFTAIAGNVGCFFWSHDVGGHFGPRCEETTTRWVQFSALGAAIRLHSARTATLDRRPWVYEPRFFEAMRGAYHLRAALMPYIYTQVRACHDRMAPLLRPMYLEHPGEAESYRRPRQYMLGEHLLVAPIVTSGAGAQCVATQAVWFPRGEVEPQDWYRWSTGERYAAGDEAVIAATIDETPVFAAGGVPIPLVEPGERMAVGCDAALRVRVWPGRPGDRGVSSLYEDDGISRGYEAGQSSTTPLRAEWSRSSTGGLRVRIEIGPTEGVFAGQRESRLVRVELAGIESVRSATVDCEPCDVATVAEGDVGLAVIDLGERSIRARTVVEAEFVSAADEAMHARHASRRLVALGDDGVGVAAPVSLAMGEIVPRVIEADGDAGERASKWAVGLGIGLVRCEVGVKPGDSDVFKMCDTHSLIDATGVVVRVIDVIGGRERERGRHMVLLSRGERSSVGVIPMPTRALAEPPLGVRATRWLRAEFRAGGRDVLLSHAADMKVTAIGREGGRHPWRIIGPFDWHWAGSITHQSGGPEFGGLEPDDTHMGKEGAGLAWTAAKSGTTWPVDFRASLGREDVGGLGYAVTYLLSQRSQRARLVIDSSDKLEAWLNGHRVHSQDGFDSAAAVEGGAWVVLKAGRNVLLVKCASGGGAGDGGWGFSVAVDGESPIIAEPNGGAGDATDHPNAG